MRLVTMTAVIVALALGAVTYAQTITFDFDRSVSFSTFRTYAWVPGTGVPDPLVQRRIVGAVDAQLAAKGLAVVQRDARPDVLVAYHASFDRDLQITGFSSGWGAYRFSGYRSGAARAEEILVGTLIVDIIDARTRTIVWRGTATRDIDVKASPEKRDKNIAKTAEKIFKNYPPR